VIRLLRNVKNNVAIEVNTFSVKVFVVCTDERVKNILAEAKLILIDGLAPK